MLLPLPLLHYIMSTTDPQIGFKEMASLVGLVSIYLPRVDSL